MKFTCVVDEIKDVEFSKQLVIETLSDALEMVMSKSGVDASTSRSECKDFEDAYHVGQIHIILSIMSTLLFAFEDEKDRENIIKLKKHLDIEIAKAEASQETKQ